MSSFWNPGEPPAVLVTPPTPLDEAPGAFARTVMEDLRAVQRNDPAARGAIEILTAYPGLHAIWLHRLAHRLWVRELTTTARLLSHFGRAITGVEIHPGATIGHRVFIDHGMGVVIGETAIIGDDCLIYKGVVLGGTSLERQKRHPTLGRGVVVGSNACILGNIAVGDGARVGSGSVVIRDVPAGATAVGVPSRIVSTTGSHAPLDHADLPDPVASVLRSLLSDIEGLTERIARLESGDDGRGQAEGELADMRRELADVFSEDLGD
jgi:serine O-acetyltransferase